MRSTEARPLAPWACKVARCEVRSAIRRDPRLGGLVEDDLVQAVLAHWCEHRDTYVSGKGASERTYMVRLVRNRLIDIARRERTEKRHALGGVVSLDEPLGDTDETRHDIVTEEIETDDDEGLRLDLESAMAGLCDREQAVCELLAEGETKSSIASRLGVSRDTVHEDIRRIRTVFCRRDLQVYI